MYTAHTSVFVHLNTDEKYKAYDNYNCDNYNYDNYNCKIQNDWPL